MKQAAMTKLCSRERADAIASRRGSGQMLLLAALIGFGISVHGATASAGGQKTFASPEAAAKALVDAAKNDDSQEILAILGPDATDIVSSGDAVQDKAAAARFTASAQQMMRLDQAGDGQEVVSIGGDNWPFPIPIVKRGDAWSFDTAAGKQEILNRRIGRNELNTIEVCQAYIDAQRQYAAEDRDGSGILKFARKFASSAGKHDGLYWPAAANEEASPIGPLVADAVAEGYSKTPSGEPAAPYHGYFYRILTSQGEHAPGAAYDYVINGNMIAGFALLAYPAQYGSSGVMTFAVNQQGVVYQKDLGTGTAQVAREINRYDPDPSWQRAE
ncbi:MAG: hypothetical protein QOK29_3656 [Rhodospirillaceae bacterium]|nr:hypothetical protein [Rhodospirillaceae bacterium]